MNNIASKKSSSQARYIFGGQDDYHQMYQMIFGFNVSQMIRSLVTYSVPEHLAHGLATAAEIAES